MAKFTSAGNLNNTLTQASPGIISLPGPSVFNINVTNFSKLDFVLYLNLSGGSLEYVTIIPAGGVYERGGVVAGQAPYQVAWSTTNTLPLDALATLGVITFYGYSD